MENKLVRRIVVPELKSNQEEADTRIVLHAKHAGGNCVIHSEDTDVLVLLLGHAHNLGKCYLQKGKGSKRRIVSISKVANQLEKQLADGIAKQEACEALMGLHALTACGTVSAFSSKGKLRPMQMLVKNLAYVKAMKNIGKEWGVNEDMFSATEKFVCHLYGKRLTSVDSLRYELHYAQGGKIAPETLPPCQSSLRLHVSHAN